MHSMAQQTVIKYVDDIDGSDLTDVPNPTILFSIDGTTYEIDLGEENQAELREVMSKYMEAARRVSGGRGRPAKARQKASESTGASPADIRAWAVQQGLDVPSRGRIPQEVRDAFEAAN